MVPECVLEGRGGLRLQEGFLQTENRSPVLKGGGLEPGSHVLKYEACWSLTLSLLRTSLELSPEEKAWISLSKVFFCLFHAFWRVLGLLMGVCLGMIPLVALSFHG